MNTVMEVYTSTPYEELGNAILLQALDDYQNAYNRWLCEMRKADTNEKVAKSELSLMESLEKRFNNGTFQVFTRLDTAYVFKMFKQRLLREGLDRRLRTR